MCINKKKANSVLLTLGPCSPGFPGGQIQGAGVEPTSLGPLRHYRDKNGNQQQAWKDTCISVRMLVCIGVCTYV